MATLLSMWMLRFAVIVVGSLCALAAPALADGGAPRPRPPAQLLPGGYRVAVEANLAALRAAGPDDAVQGLLQAFAPQLAPLGVDLSRVQQLAVALNPQPRQQSALLLLDRESRIGSAVIDRDALPDPLRLLRAAGPLAERTYRGVRLSSVGPTGRGLAQLPAGPLALASQAAALPRLIDVFQGRASKALLSGAPERLLARAGRGAGSVAAVYARLSEEEQRGLRARGFSIAPLEAALALNPATAQGSGELRVLGRCARPEDAKVLQRELEQKVSELQERPELLLLGLSGLARALRVEGEGDQVLVRLPLARSDYADLLFRAAGLAGRLDLGALGKVPAALP